MKRLRQLMFQLEDAYHYSYRGCASLFPVRLNKPLPLRRPQRARKTRLLAPRTSENPVSLCWMDVGCLDEKGSPCAKLISCHIAFPLAFALLL